MLKIQWIALLVLSLVMAGCNQATDGSGKPVAVTPTNGPEPTVNPKTNSTANANKDAVSIKDGKEVAVKTTTDDTKKPATPEKPKRAEIVIAGGCFWCVEAVFEELEGVIEAVSGYSGGTKETAIYELVCEGTTGHAEAVKIIYDPTKITYEKLLAVHFATHDPTTLNRQGHDVGTQYRSAIFYANDDEKKTAQAVIDRLTEAKAFPRKIVTTLEPLTAFYVAEIKHQNYVCDNPYDRYVVGVALPKVEKVREKFKDDLKKPKGPVEK